MSLPLRRRSTSDESTGGFLEGVRRVALVLWHGDLGGSEVMSVALAKHFRQMGVDASVVFVGRPEPLASRLRLAHIPYTTLGFRRGRTVLRHPRRYAAQVRQAGPHGALLIQCGFMGSALRAGGYCGRIIAVEHGPMRDRPGFSRYRRIFGTLDRASGAWAADVEVAVSDYVLAEIRRGPHAHDLVRIHNGIDPADSQAAARQQEPGPPADGLTVGFMGRLVPGKGAEVLIRALAAAKRTISARLLVAGAGPERPHLMAVADRLGIGSDVVFLGVIDDVPAFWAKCDIAVVPTTGWEEAFSMVTLEAMSCGKAIIASRCGAIPELLLDGVTGKLISPGDTTALAHALIDYGLDPSLRVAHASAARGRAVEYFHIRDCARAYLDLLAPA